MAFSTNQGSGASDRTSYVGTSGVDSIVFEGNTENFFLGAQEANDFIAFDNVAALQTGTYTNGELRGGSGNDSFLDRSGAGVSLVGTWINGNSGDDLIGGTAATALIAFNSTIQGGQGADTIRLANGTGTIYNGNKGNDNLFVNGSISASTIGGGQGNDNITYAGAATDRFSGNKVFLGLGNDTFTRTLGLFGDGNSFDGADGNDRINVGTATNTVTILGGDGTDALVAGTDDDVVDGGAGNDAIFGGLGDDTLTGGGGSNIFQYTLQTQSATDIVGGSTDVLTDFNSATDTIDQTNFSIGTAAGAVTGGGYASYTAALAAVSANIAQDAFSVVGVGSGTSWTSYLLGNSTNSAGANTVDFAVQIGATGAYASAAQAGSTVIQADFT